jgi:hypothetical protein
VADDGEKLGPGVGLLEGPLEPSYGIALGNGNKKSVGLTGGIFFAFRKFTNTDPQTGTIHCSFVLIPQQPIKKLPLPFSSVARY